MTAFHRKPTRLTTFFFCSMVTPTLIHAAGQTPDAQRMIEQSAPMAKDAHPSLEVVTIKPSDPNDRSEGFQNRDHRIYVRNETLIAMISFAYNVHKSQIFEDKVRAIPDRYDVQGLPNIEGIPNIDQYREMLQKLLADRFHLQFHRENREIPVYALIVAKGDPKIQKSKRAPEDLRDQTTNGSGDPWVSHYTNNSMPDFADGLEYWLDRPVVDRTGLAGKYDFVLKWTRDDVPDPSPNAPPGLFTALQEQLGLKLEPTKAPAQVLVIDHVERPSAD